MRNCLTFFTRNWTLKLLAFVLALVVFYGVRGSLRSHGSADSRILMKGPVHAEPAR